jgi:hypothetical protein
MRKTLLQATTLALLAALAYEMLLKISHLLVPLFPPPVEALVAILSLAVAAVLIAFLIAFHQEERKNPRVALFTKLLLLCLLLRILLRLQGAGALMDFQSARLASVSIDLLQALVLFALLLSFRGEIPSQERALKAAGLLLTVLAGIGILRSFLAFLDFLRFVTSGAVVEPSRIFQAAVFVLFLLTHGSMIYFLYYYARWKFPRALKSGSVR